MTGDEHRVQRESLGDLALGRLGDGESAALRAHLDGCADCRAELDELSSVLPALSRANPDALDPTPVPPSDLGERIVSRARAEGREAVRRAPRRWVPVAAAATATVLVGGTVGYLVGADDGIPREPVTVQAMTPGVTATAVAIPHTWGVEISLDAAGFRSGAVYRVVVQAEDGRTVDAGQFLGTGQSSMRCNLNSSVLRSDAARFQVLDDRDAVVVLGEL